MCSVSADVTVGETSDRSERNAGIFTDEDIEIFERAKRDLESRIAERDAENASARVDLRRVNDILKRTRGEPVDNAVLSYGCGGKLMDMVRDVFLEQPIGRSLHLRDILQAVEERGGEVKGANKLVSLTARIGRDERFCRTMSGYYGLKADFPCA